MADVAEKKVMVTRLDADAKEVTGKVGREKYALGRRFFVTGVEGYMGLAPPCYLAATCRSFSGRWRGRRRSVLLEKRTCSGI
jgi:hypothetical protein